MVEEDLQEDRRQRRRAVRANGKGKKERRKKRTEVVPDRSISEKSARRPLEQKPQAVPRIAKPPERPKNPFARKQEKREPLRIQVGLDFGTSGTKVAYRRFDDPRTRAIHWDHHLPGYSDFILPSVAAALAGGGLKFGDAAVHATTQDSSWRELRNLKVILAGKHDPGHRDDSSRSEFIEHLGLLHDRLDGLAEEYVNSLFLAFVMDRVRAVMSCLAAFKDHDLDLQFNVCLPIDHIELEGLWAVFSKTVACAELCAREWSVLSRTEYDPEHWRRLWDRAEYGHAGERSFLRSDPTARAFVVPEAVAQVASYVTSLERKDGIHALIDFGAGTTDLSIFKLVTTGDNHWFASSSVPLGCRSLDDQVSDLFDLGSASSPSPVGNLTEVYEVTRSDLLSEDSGGVGYLLDIIQKHLDTLYEATKRVWGEAAQKEKTESSWYEVSIFTMGGGALLRGVDETFSTPVPYGLLRRRGIRYPIWSITRPKDYVDDKSAPFSRMAVAYGLSIPAPQLSEYVLPRNAPDHTPLRVEHEAVVGVDGGSGVIPRGGWV